jgi:hypothetical protein
MIKLSNYFSNIIILLLLTISISFAQVLPGGGGGEPLPDPVSTSLNASSSSRAYVKEGLTKLRTLQPSAITSGESANDFAGVQLAVNEKAVKEGEEPGEEEPPVEEPPVEDPPVEDPPVEDEPKDELTVAEKTRLKEIASGEGFDSTSGEIKELLEKLAYYDGAGLKQSEIDVLLLKDGAELLTAGERTKLASASAAEAEEDVPPEGK